MVQEAESTNYVLLALLVLYGYRVDLRIRLAIDQRPADRAIMGQVYVTITVKE